MAAKKKKEEGPAKPPKYAGVDLLSAIRMEHGSMYDRYTFRIRFRGRMLGGVPKSLDVALLAAEAKLRAAKAPPEVVERIKAEVAARIAEAEAAFAAKAAAAAAAAMDFPPVAEGEAKPASANDEHPVTGSNWVIFWEDAEGIYFESRCLKSAIRECMSKLRFFVGEGNTGTKGVHDYGLFVEPARLRFERDGAVLTSPDGFQDRAITVSGPAGRRTTIKREDFVECTEMAFTIKVIRNSKITRDKVIAAVALLQDAGVGGARSQCFGQSDVIVAHDDGTPVGPPPGIPGVSDGVA